MGLLERWRRWRAGAPKRRQRRLMAAVRKQSAYLGKRPFSDQFDGDGFTNDGTAGRSGRRS